MRSANTAARCGTGWWPSTTSPTAPGMRRGTKLAPLRKSPRRRNLPPGGGGKITPEILAVFKRLMEFKAERLWLPDDKHPQYAATGSTCCWALVSRGDCFSPARIHGKSLPPKWMPEHERADWEPRHQSSPRIGAGCCRERLEKSASPVRLAKRIKPMTTPASYPRSCRHANQLEPLSYSALDYLKSFGVVAVAVSPSGRVFVCRDPKGAACRGDQIRIR